jgi:hypothetical protein
MYGMINRALEDMVLAYHGQETWRAIQRKANVDVEMFVRMETYPDSMTYSLVGAASEILGKSVPDLLRDFGLFWVRFTGNEGYGPLLDEAGDNLTEVLRTCTHGDWTRGRTRGAFEVHGRHPSADFQGPWRRP